MHNHEQHLSDEDLLLAAADEPGRRADRFRTHLEFCERCRSQAALMENVLTDVAQAEKDVLDTQIPSVAGPRALLRTRLADSSTCRTGLITRAFSVAAFAALIVVVGLLAPRQSMMKADLLLIPSDRGLLPNASFTPGFARQASLPEVCSFSREEVVAPVPAAMRQRVFAEYGIPIAQSGKYEVDYLITPGLGGDDDIRNLWPEPYDAAEWNAHTKDVLEERLHEMVCARKLDLVTAQEAISTNWIAAYEKYIESDTGNFVGSQHPSA